MGRNIVIEHFIEQSKEYNWEYHAINTNIHISLEGRVLEVGNGSTLEYYSENTESVGVDITPTLSRLCKKKYPLAHVITGDVCHLPFKPEVFDYIVSVNLLHHLVGNSFAESKNYIRKAVYEIKSSLKTSGSWIVYDAFTRNILFSYLIFYFTLFFAKIGLEIKKLDIHSKVVTHFTTEKWFKTFLLAENFSVKVLFSNDWWVLYSNKWFVLKINLGKNGDIFQATKQNFNC